MKKITAGLAALMLALGLTACRPDSGGGSGYYDHYHHYHHYSHHVVHHVVHIHHFHH